MSGSGSTSPSIKSSEIGSPNGEPTGIPNSQDSVVRIVSSFMQSQGSQESQGTASGTDHIYASNHYEVDNEHLREQMEYSIRHRLDIVQGATPQMQGMFSQQQMPLQYEGHPYMFVPSHMPATLISPQGMPNNLSEPSIYKFGLLFGPDQPTAKSSPQTYSHRLKLFIAKRSTRCTLVFSFEQLPPEGSRIKAIAVYKSPVLLSENVECCASHREEGSKEVGAELASHFVRCLDKGVQYEGPNPTTGHRNQMVIPLSSLQSSVEVLNAQTEDVVSPGATTKCYTYTGIFIFPCYTCELPKQCKGVVQILFGLEVPLPGGGYFPIARTSLDVRVCSSTGRDKDILESRLEGQASESEERRPGKGKSRKRKDAVVQDIVVSSKRSKLNDEDSDEEGTYTVTTKHKDIYQMLEKIKNSLELTKCLTKEQLSQAAKDGIILPDVCSPSSQVGDGEKPSQSKDENIHNSVADLLRSLGLERHIKVFRKLGIVDLFQLENLRHETLREAKIPEQDIRKIVVAITNLPIPGTEATSSSQISLLGGTQQPQYTETIEFRMRRNFIANDHEPLFNGELNLDD